MTKKTKIYQFTDHGVKPTAICYVRASSQKEVAEITGRMLSRIKPYLNEATGAHVEKYKHLAHGEYEHAMPHVAPKGISVLDLERIAALGYLKSARLSLNQCDLQDPKLKSQLAKILGDIDDLRADVCERLEGKYSGR
ncbi:conserved hypothetical protein [Vibrio chagasii]|nr:conserved hypothetical protein [Vibrio chagasii]